jgi:hypothetical protein
MKKKACMRLIACMLVLSLAIPAGVFAQDIKPPPLFRQEELAQMLAPIALYPDALLVQVLMAATYPLEVVAADRWVQANQNIQGDGLAIALEQRNWDPSVKSLVNFPTVLAMMSDQLEWTQRLGDAFLSQKDQVMDTVQELRVRAQNAGTLTTTREQAVIIQDRDIIIEPVNPEVIYVPVYNPTIAYGPWWYPAYPPYYYYPPGYIIGSGLIGFGVGLFVGAAWGYAWGGCNWRNHRVYINPYQNMAFNKHINRYDHAKWIHGGDGGRSEWKHDPNHRKGVAYRDVGTRQQYNQAVRPGLDTRKDFRPSPQTAGAKRAAITVPSGSGQRMSGAAQGQAALHQRTMTSTPAAAPRVAQNRSTVSAGRNQVALTQKQGPPAVNGPAMQQRREMPKMTTQPNRPATTSAGIAAASYRGPGTMSTSYRGGTSGTSLRSGGGFSPGGAGGGFSVRSGGPTGRGGRHS